MEDTQKLKYKAKLINGKLTLTSSNIQVGDEVYDDQTLTKNKILKDWMNGFIKLEVDNVSFAEKSRYFKAVGEISPEATWVKEGDEFDETQIRSKRFDSLPDNSIIIKGPCGHFH